MNYLQKNTQRLIDPIASNISFFLSVIVLLYIPTLAYWIKNYSLYYKHYGLLALPAVFFAAYTLSFFVKSVKNESSRNIIKELLLSLIYLFVIIETYIIIFFGTRFSLSIISLVMETNSSEACGFITSYIFTPSFSKYIVGVIIFTIFLYYINTSSVKIKIEKVCKNLIKNKIIKLFILFFIITCLPIGVFREVRNLYWHKYDIDEIGRIRKNSVYSTSYISFSCLYDAIRLYWLSTYDLPMLVETLKNAQINSCRYRSKNIVVIIGESYSKHHSNLYSYSLNTNPLLKKEDNLYLFNNAITTDALTSLVLKNIFSFRDKENNLYWAKTILFPTIFKKAGYYCTFISNQEVQKGNSSDVYDMSNDYLVNPKTVSYLWDQTNNEKCRFDMQLIDKYIGIKDSITPYSLTVFHLLGQHTAYEDRYPSDKRIFTVEDYINRTDLTDYQKNIVAHYDNATRYCDEVLKSIIDFYRNDDAIVIFLSDHGEEVHDYRNYAGRSHEPRITAKTAKYVFEVPFFIWMSDKYKEVHPDIVKSVEFAIDKPFVIDDLPHLLLDLAGIECKMFDPTHSILNKEYLNRRRLIGGQKQDYDSLMF